MSELMDNLNGKGRYLEHMSEKRRKLCGDDVPWILFARSQAHEAGLTYENEPDLAAFDRLLLAHAEEIVEVADGFEYSENDPRRESIGPRPYGEEHWWWYLDEILAGTRPRPQVP
jgi:hypothetical protein